MSGDFYQVLFYSLLLTGGAVLLYFGYRYLMARFATRPSAFRYVTLRNLENGKAKGEIVFNFYVPENLHLKLEVTDLNDQVVVVLEDKLFEEGDFKIPFDSLKVSDGEYFYRITTPHQQTAKKFRVKNA